MLCRLAASSIVYTDTFMAIIEGKRLSQLRMHDDHHSGFCSRSFNLSLRLTPFQATDHIGFFPPLTQKGDVIAILDGCALPAVLRKFGDHYNFVGLSYIWGR